MNVADIEIALSAAERPLLLESAADVELAAEAWEQCPVLGIDTEFLRERTYRAELGLVQVSDGRRAWLVDPLAEGAIAPLERLLTHPGLCKVLHSGSEDLEVLFHTVGVIPDPLVDTQIACAMLGQPLQMGYHHAVKWLTDVDIDKDQTRSNWIKRPLHAKQLRYAAMDVVLLPMMHRMLKARLEEVGRWNWLQEEIKRMQGNAVQAPAPEEAYLRFSAAGRLDEETLRVLRALAAWREQTAIEKNRARGFVISDAGLLQIARLKPANAGQLKAIEDIHPVVLSRHGAELLRIVDEALNSETPVEPIEALTGAQNRKMKAMRKLITERAEKLELDPALLASRKELEKLLRAHAAGEPPPERFMGWRREVITDDLLNTLAQSG